MVNHHRITLESGQKRVFASALDWPGWSRSGKNEDDAIATLVNYAVKYQRVAERAGVRGVAATAADPQVVERQQGSGATDFGVPDNVAEVEHEPLTKAECERQIKLLLACWDEFDEVAARVSAEMQKGPRGGGRDRDEIIRHTLAAEVGYARQIGVKNPRSIVDTPAGIREHRQAVIEAIRDAQKANAETKWPLRYFLRRAAWHVLDHAWEMEDKDLSDSKQS